MSRHQFHVSTSFLPTVGFPGRDTKNLGRDLPHCHPCRDLKMMSRHQVQPSQVVTSKPSRDQPLFPSQNALVATQKPGSRRQTFRRQSIQVATSISGRDLKLTRPGRDLKVMSRPQIVFLRSQHEFHVTTQDLSVLTSDRSRHQKGCRGTNSSSLGRDAKTMSRPSPVWLRLRASCPGRGGALALSWARPFLLCVPAAFLSRPQN